MWVYAADIVIAYWDINELVRWSCYPSRLLSHILNINKIKTCLIQDWREYWIIIIGFIHERLLWHLHTLNQICFDFCDKYMVEHQWVLSHKIEDKLKETFTNHNSPWHVSAFITSCSYSFFSFTSHQQVHKFLFSCTVFVKTQQKNLLQLHTGPT